MIRKVVKVLFDSILCHEVYTIVFWRAEDNSIVWSTAKSIWRMRTSVYPI